MKALRNEFPKFYPQIHIIVQKVQKISLSRSFPIATKVLTTIYIDNKEHKKVKKGLDNCISAVACNKYSILTCRKARNQIEKPFTNTEVY